MCVTGPKSWFEGYRELREIGVLAIESHLYLNLIAHASCYEENDGNLKKIIMKTFYNKNTIRQEKF